jgi:hypothetical protein
VWELKKIEEPELIKRLGDGYIDYRRRTPPYSGIQIKKML